MSRTGIKAATTTLMDRRERARHDGEIAVFISSDSKKQDSSARLVENRECAELLLTKVKQKTYSIALEFRS
jgi:hypothetical protein